MSRPQIYAICGENPAMFSTAFSKTEEDDEDTKLFYGVELEVENPIKEKRTDVLAIEVNKDIGDYVNIRHECSIDNGFEIVTIPATLNFHRKTLWKDFFDKSGANVVASEKTGLHIHFSRDGVVVKQLAKCIYFIHETTNSGFLSKIAGRRVWADAKWASQRKKTYVSGQEGQIIESETGMGVRRALSVSSNTGGITCELRIFKSNPTKHGVLQALEFTDCLLKYCKECPDDERALSFKQFVSWVKETDKKDEYPYFYDNLLLHGLVKKTLLGKLLLSCVKAA